MNNDFVINSESSLHDVLGKIRMAFKEYKYLRINFNTMKSRSLDQNALMHAWFVQIASELGHSTPFDIKCECKLRFGVPILRARIDGEFRAIYDAVIKPCDYEQKVSIMRWMPITSEMSTDELSEMLEKMKEEYANQGIELEFPT